jgi:hypothetical protein
MTALQLLLPALALLAGGARADTPANCTYQVAARTALHFTALHCTALH